MNTIPAQFRRALRSGFGHGQMGMMNHQRMDHPLTEGELREYAPSIFAEEAHVSRSARFTPVPTFSIVEGLRGHGFLPFAAKQSKSRDEDRLDYTKHLVRFRREGDGNGTYRNDDAIAEIVLVNANDGSSSYQLYGGMFRTLCLNGLIVADSLIQSVRIGHTGNIIDKVIEGSYAVLEQTQRALEVRDRWKALQLTAGESQAFANAAHVLRFGEPENDKPSTPIQPHQLLGVRREEDRSNDLWTTFNRVQENAIRGGLTARTKAGYVPDKESGRDVFKPSRKVQTREVRGIDQDVRLNKALWVLAENLEGLKQAA